MVCLGNICRSPLAEGILRHKISKHGLDWHVESAGTSGWHAGDPPDIRSQEVAKKNGIDISTQKARPFRSVDIDEFDHIFVMDHSNHKEVSKHAETDEERQKIKLILDETHPGENKHVPDPYWDDNGFHSVFELLENACDAIILKYAGLASV
ncbi:MAG: low molecular weight phosphotyrosine protein phosphatase [Chitinophagales bacterium]|nr:low molecular weight phosphotyrosine protein phosphatase [Chitinophagales bacterium]